MEKVSYHGWADCYRLTNGLVDLIVTGDVGPRIIRFGFVGEENEFKEYEAMLGQTGGQEWRIYGGHRLWYAPEHSRRTYYPDNFPVCCEEHPGFLRVIQAPETGTGIQKEMDLRLSLGQAHVQVTHRLRNTGWHPLDLAPWALSVLAPGGTAIVPLPPRGPHPQFLQPASTIALWPYTDLSDPRWTWGRQYVLLRQDKQADTPQKAGFLVPDGWAAYVRAGHLFLLRFEHLPDATYPDLGSSLETWTDADMLELETLGPLVRLEPGAVVEHIEHWHLFRDVATPLCHAHVVQHILPKVRAAGDGE
ncbi:MAG: hypothetical protein FJ026_06660 [Chloroflexi bacterium]|nr:hypothetical protein [Chloroflexota bacterium]